MSLFVVMVMFVTQNEVRTPDRTKNRRMCDTNPASDFFEPPADGSDEAPARSHTLCLGQPLGIMDRRPAGPFMVRIDRLAAGNPGDVKPVGGGISELRIDYGPGYRVYYRQEGQRLLLLLLLGRQVDPTATLATQLHTLRPHSKTAMMPRSLRKR